VAANDPKNPENMFKHVFEPVKVDSNVFRGI